MKPKYKAKIRLIICSIPFIVFFANMLIQIPICMHYEYPMLMLGIDTYNWKEAWLINNGLYLICSLFILIPCGILWVMSLINYNKST